MMPSYSAYEMSMSLFYWFLSIRKQEVMWLLKISVFIELKTV